MAKTDEELVEQTASTAKADSKVLDDAARGTTTESTASAQVELPYHVFSPAVCYLIVSMVSCAAMLSGLSSNVYFPAQQDVATALHTTPSLVNWSITTYLIAQGLAPSFWGPLADSYGRRKILIVTLCVYVGANIALALVQNPPMLLIFRAVQAAGSSSTISLGAGAIADISSPSQRGGLMGIFSGGRQFSVAIGPVIGGVLAGTLGFRSIFWFLAIFSGSITLCIALLFPETLRRIAANGSMLFKLKRSYLPLLSSMLPYTKQTYTTKRYPEQAELLKLEASNEISCKIAPKFQWSVFARPFGILIEKDVGCALFFGACTYTAWSMMVATTTVLLKKTYHFNTIQVGLCFLANGIGCVMGSVLSGFTLNSSFAREATAWQHQRALPHQSPIPRPLPESFPIEKARLSDAPLYSAIMSIGFLVFGWSLTPTQGYDHNGQPGIAYAGHWITPLLAQFMVGYSNTAVLNSNNTLIVDLFPGQSASASAVINLSRNLTAAVGVAIVDYIEDAVSPGWLSVILVGLVCIGLGPFSLHAVYGKHWRAQRESRKRDHERRRKHRSATGRDIDLQRIHSHG